MSIELKTYLIMDVEPVEPEELQKKSGRALTDWQDAQTRDNLHAIQAFIETEVAPFHPVEFISIDSIALLIKTDNSGMEAIKKFELVGHIGEPTSPKLLSGAKGRRTLNFGVLPPEID